MFACNMRYISLFHVSMICVLIHNSSPKTVSYVTVVRWDARWECVSKIMWWCSVQRKVYDPVYGKKYKCAPRYGGSGCKPICEPRCQNNGKCERPGYCNCPEGITGDDCGKIKTCSFRKPCFPGVCGRDEVCRCADGFKGTGDEECLIFENSQEPKITKCTTQMINFYRAKNNEEQYRYITDSSHPNETEPDRLWSNQKDFNFINIYFKGIYDEPEIKTIPEYISNYTFGVTAASARILHTMIPRPDGSRSVKNDNTTICGKRTDSVYLQEGNFECNITIKDYVYVFESGDKFSVTVSITNGGYRTLSSNKKQDYTGQKQEKSMIFRFDYDKPYFQSSEKDKYLYLSKDITKTSFKIFWKGWKDSLSGVFKYEWQVFKLEADKETYTHNLTEINPWTPMYMSTVSAEEVQFPQTYEPEESGMYSILLQVSDAANNTILGRTLALYDPHSDVTINNDKDKRIVVISAEKESDWLWQSTVDNEDKNGEPIVVSWKGHFSNIVHEKEKLLNAVNEFPALKQVKSNFTVTKEVPQGFQGSYGTRTMKKIENVHGIVKFVYAFKKDHQGGSLSQTAPKDSNKWNEVVNLADQRVSFAAARADGDTIRIWIKAFDVMGNDAVDSVVVHFDSSPPTVNQTIIDKNKNSSLYHYASRIQLYVFDKDSGIKEIKWRFKYDDSDELFKSGVSLVNFTNKEQDGEIDVTEGVCISTSQCFTYLQYIYFDNCWLAVPKAKLDTQVIKVELDIYNMAMVSTAKTLYIKKLKSYDGIEAYNGPLNLTVVGITDTGVLLRWKKMPTCYNITYISVTANSTTGTSRYYKIEKHEVEFNLAYLNPLTNYTMVFITHYEEEQSDPVIFNVVTLASPPSGLSTAGKVGISLTIIVLVGVIIAGLVLWRTGHLAKTREVIRYRLTVYRKAAPEITEYDDDIYMYGQMDVQGKQSWLISNDDIVLENLLTSGRFADIFLSRYNTTEGKTNLVISKVLKKGFSEEDKILMQAKINFYGTQVGDHPNVLAFIGSVENNAALGPYMVLEFCENGNLRDWLQTKKRYVSEDTIETMHRLSLEVAKGMEYLSSKQIVHRRLAARNVLLTEDLQPKIAGFGPTTTSNEQEADSSSQEKRSLIKRLESAAVNDTSADTETLGAGCLIRYDDEAVEETLKFELLKHLKLTFNNVLHKERIPVKWVAPECIKSMKMATLESDVWSYGIVMWEIFSLGDAPYPGIRSREIPMRVKTGYRMKRPEHADDTQYEMMKRCWAEKPETRPSFSQILEEINQTFVAQPAADEYYMDAFSVSNG